MNYIHAVVRKPTSTEIDGIQKRGPNTTMVDNNALMAKYPNYLSFKWFLGNNY